MANHSFNFVLRFTVFSLNVSSAGKRPFIVREKNKAQRYNFLRGRG